MFFGLFSSQPRVYARVMDNLRLYIRDAQLPDLVLDASAPPTALPPSGHKTHRNALSVRGERYRLLEHINGIDMEEFVAMVSQWNDEYMPAESTGMEDHDYINGESPTVPAPSFTHIGHAPLRRPSDLTRLLPWIDSLPLLTVQRIMHVLFYDETKGHTFQHGPTDMDSAIWRYLLWAPALEIEGIDGMENPNMMIERFRRSVLVAVQPPWILGEHDIKNFANLRHFPPFRGVEPQVGEKAEPSDLESKQRIWAKLWDTCVRNNTHWFVLTNYNQWVFGHFSSGWTTAFVSPVFNYDSETPTVMECLTFWLASASQAPSSRAIPKVPEPVRNWRTINFTESDIPFADPNGSESEWSGKDDDLGDAIESASGILSTDSHEHAGRRAPIFRMDDQVEDSVTKVNQWDYVRLQLTLKPPQVEEDMMSTGSTETQKGDPRGHFMA
ncbi:hypothetical protein K523DRAFT_320698 [Schizophyllum commune Tattone D]|nr:hypothetical protein K525DRAFT_254798 [Schizophyllum commune Loenen D]KAI5835048.1 hypothetical protein K523DRAFT_320698 [Schizophyllum commune Tattone D]